MSEKLNQTEITVLKVMHSKKIYGKNHKRIETILRSGFPRHEINNVKQAIYLLIQKQYVVWYHKADKSIQLNKEKYNDIDDIIKNNLQI